MRIFITGDTHGDIDIAKLSSLRNLTKKDYVIIAGDFGAIWNQDKSILYRYEHFPFTTLFLDGNHENFELLAQYPIVPFAQASAQRISKSVYHLLRGQVYALNGKTFFTMGGASSHDKELRIEHLSWWSQELPSYAEMRDSLDNLALHGKKVDFIVSHCAPSSIQEKISPYYEKDTLTDFLEEVKNTANFKKWYFGHYHEDSDIGEKFTCLYNNIIEIKE